MKSSFALVLCLFSLSFLSSCGGAGAKIPPVLPTVTNSASPGTINFGQSTVLTWSSTNATSCTASASPSENDWSGLKPTSGSQTVTPSFAGAIIYSLFCSGSGGTATSSASVTANPPGSNFTITSGPLPAGAVGVQYGTSHQLNSSLGRYFTYFFFQLTATGGSGRYTWGLAPAPGSSYPPGLSCCEIDQGTMFPPDYVHAFGVIYGTPTAPGTFNVLLSVSDGGRSEEHTSE